MHLLCTPTRNFVPVLVVCVLALSTQEPNPLVTADAGVDASTVDLRTGRGRDMDDGTWRASWPEPPRLLWWLL